MRRKIYFFTNSFPFGIGEQWKLNELAVMSRQFSEIEIFPFKYDGNTVPKKIPYGNVRFNPPFFTSSLRVGFKDFKRVFLSRYAAFFLQEFFTRFVFLSKKKIISFLSDAVRAIALTEHQSVKQLLLEQGQNDVFYFFWGKNSCLFVPLVRKKIKAKIFLRLHGYDLYESRNDNYIPFRYKLLKSVNTVLTISSDGMEYLKTKYPAFEEKLIVNRLGTISRGISQSSQDRVLRLFSCSSIIPLKRLSLLANALKALTFQIEWVHIGDGPLRDELLSITESYGPNITFMLTGWVSPDQVLSYYVSKRCDLFINVSDTEGIPVSIMEAFSAAIPVFATDVGGVSEIVNARNGKLLNVNIQEDELAREISNFYALSLDEMSEFRTTAFTTYSKKYDALVNASKLTDLFLQDDRNS